MASTIVDRFNVAPEEGIKAPCRMATTANITLSGLQTIDTIVGAVDDRVLVKSQTDATENGIYLMRAEAWVRAPDWNDNTDVLNGVLVAVAEGAANATNEFMVSFSGSFAIDTTAVTFINRTGLSTSEIDSRAVRYFDTLALLDAETDLSVGERVSLAGRFAAGDDGANTYKIVAAGTGTHDNGRYIDLAGSGLQAFGLFEDARVTAKRFGAKGDGATDDRAAIALADADGDFILTSGTYKISSNITIANKIVFEPGARLSIDSGVTVTFTKQPDADYHTQIFEGLGDVANLSLSHCEWFMGDDVNTSTVSVAGIQKAMDAAKTSHIVALPLGYFTSDGTAINVTKGQRVLGYGRFLSTLQWNSSNCTGFVFTTTIAPTLEKMSLVVNDPTIIPASGIAIKIESSALFWGIDDVFCRNAYEALDVAGTGRAINLDLFDSINIGMYVHDCNDVFLSNFLISAPLDYFALTGTSGTFVEGETITGGTSGATGPISVINQTLLKCKEDNINFTASETITGGTSGATATLSTITRTHQLGGIRLFNKVEAFICHTGDVIGGIYPMTTDAASYTVGVRPAYNKFSNVYFDSADNGVRLDKCVATRFDACWFSNRPLNGLDIYANNEDISFNNCDFINCWQNGAFVRAGATNIRFNSCTASGNNASGGSHDGLAFEAGCTDFIVQGGRYGGTLGFGTQRYGIHVNTGASDRYIIADTLVSGNATAGVQDGGTGTNKRVADNY